MAQIKIVLLSDSGEEIQTRFYELSNNLEQLNDMEREIECLRPSILGDMTHDLLAQAQSAQSCDKKKSRQSGFSRGHVKNAEWLFSLFGS